MKGLFVKLLVAAALVAAVVVPAAAAKSPRRAHSHSVNLAVAVLPKTAFGPAGASLPTDLTSGPVSNQDVADDSATPLDPRALKKIGRIGGYRLGYGDMTSFGTFVGEIVTQVDEYKSPADATKGLAFWKKQDPHITALGEAYLRVGVKPLKLRSVGARHYGFLTRYTALGQRPLYVGDEKFTEGKFVLEVTVSSASSARVVQFLQWLSGKLDGRIRSAFAGRLHAKPVSIPLPQNGGPPPGGPDLSTLVLTPKDFGEIGVHNILQGYDYAPPAISEFAELIQPIGKFDVFEQSIDWYASPTEAAYRAALSDASFAYLFGFFGEASSPRVNLTTVGDDARGLLFGGGSGGGSLAVVTLRRGQATDEIFAIANSTTLAPKDVRSVAQLAANKLNAGLAG